ncbi:MAG: hypothetical protein AB7G13_14565 [Lautropia sp.]
MSSISGKVRTALVALAAATLAACGTAITERGAESRDAAQAAPGPALPAEVTAESFARERASKGVVLFDVNWGRRWNCGGFENAELRRIEFDRMPASARSDDAAGDVVWEVGPSLVTPQRFVNYAALLEPGEYALAGYRIKVAKSVNDILILPAIRSRLRNDDPRRQGGSFRVAAGETVYIGNFWLDCHGSPMLWRYYSEGGRDFNQHLAEYKAKYPFLDLQRVTYRLFETRTHGEPYRLP